MANSENKKLAVDVIARIDKLEKGMAKAAQTVNKQAAVMESRVGKMSKAFSSVGASAFNPLMAGATGAVASLLSVSAILGKTKEALTDFGDIADKALSAGLDPEVFQALTYQASLFGVELGTVSGALDTFAKNAGLAVVGKGKMVKSLQALNPALLENIRNAKDQATRIRLAADAINEAKTASEKAAIATTMFGDAGTKLVGVFDGGAAAIDRTAAAARSLGIIIDRDLIARSDELGDQLDTVSKIIDVQLKQALIDLAPVMIGAANLAANFAAGLGAVVDRWRDLENMTGRGLEMKVKTLGLEDLELERKILEKQAEARDVSPLASSLGFGIDSATVQKEIADLVAQRGENAKQQAEILKILSDRDAAAAKAITTPNTAAAPSGTLAPIATPGASTSRNKAAEDAVRQAEAVQKLISDLQVERVQVGMTEVEIAKMNALRQAGAAATEEQRAQIIDLIEATAREKAAVDAVKESMDFAKDAANGFLSDLRAGLEDGKLDWQDFGNAALNVLNKIIDKIQGQLVDALFEMGNTGGGLGGILGALFGGTSSSGAGGSSFATGGYTGPGGKYQPAGIVHKGEYVFDAAATKRIGVRNLRQLQGFSSGGLVGAPRMPSVGGRGGGGGGSLSTAITVQVEGVGDKDLLGKIHQGVAVAIKRNNEFISKEMLPRRVPAIARDPRKIG